MKKIESFIETGIFASRWIQAPIYVGLIAAQLIFAYRFIVEVIHLFHYSASMSENILLQTILALVDIVMVVNLITMVVIGGWTTFVSKLDLHGNPDKPKWLGHIDPGTLKTKLAGALITISGIHLLKTFTQLGDSSTSISQHQVLWQVVIHLTFVLSTVVLAYSDLLVQKKIKMEEHKDHD
ncbi:MAG: TIGR00645 family protein [Fibrobacteres bacterium]|nr:TIGR00645 family protein [Fibrobacterota bacterium]